MFAFSLIINLLSFLVFILSDSLSFCNFLSSFIRPLYNAHEFHILKYNSYDKGIIYKSGYDYTSKKYSLDFINYFSNVFHWSINKTSNSLILFDELTEKTFYEIPDIDEHIRDNKDMIELYF